MSNLTKKWKFCPVCASALGTKQVEGRGKLACTKCSFLFYDNPIPVVAALVLTEGGIVLVKRGVEPFIGGWCLPRGFIDTDERPKQAIAREVREEAGLYVWLKRILCQCNPSPADFPLNQVTTFFLATLRGGKLQFGSDCQDAQVFPFDQLPPLCFPTDEQMIKEWQSGTHGTIDTPVNFPQRSTFLLEGESKGENGRVKLGS